MVWPVTTSRRVCRAWCELFEARTPKGKAPIAEAAGRVRIEEGDRTRKLVIVRDDGEEDLEYLLPRRVRLEWEDATLVKHAIRDGDHVEAGQQLCAGTLDPQDILRVNGLRRCRSTWSRRCRPCTGRRAPRSTTSTSRSSSDRCCVG